MPPDTALHALGGRDDDGAAEDSRNRKSGDLRKHTPRVVIIAPGL